MQYKIISTGTKEYEQMINLRLEVLLNPIGIPASYINPEKEKEDILIGAFNDSELIGCCILTQHPGDVIQLRQMAVKNILQHSGIGTKIVTQAETIALQKGFKQLFMHARDNVIAFYMKCGYSVEGDVFYEVGIPHHKMEKNLC